MDEKEERMWGMFSHVGALVGSVVPFGNVIVPLVIWQIKKDESEFVADQAKESLNFQISILIYAAVSVLLAVVFCIGFVLLAAVAIFDIVVVIIAAIRANEGEMYRYPLCIRLIS